MKTMQPTSLRTPKPCEPQKCPDCYSLLEQFDNLKYCENCKKCPILMDNSLRQPNYNFKQHYQDNKISSAIIKVQGHAKDILCKLGMRVTDCQIDRIVGMVRDMHWRRGLNCKGYRQETALIIYRLFEDQIRMTIHQFCNKTGIPKKKFNKMLIYYQNMTKNTETDKNTSEKLPKLQDDIYQSESIELKQEDSHQLPKQQQVPDEQSPIENEQYLNFPTYIQPQSLKFQQHPISSPIKTNLSNIQVIFNEREQRQVLTRTIQILYDKIFTHVYLRKHKNQLVKNIIEKSLALYQEFLSCGDGNIPKKYFRAPAIIYNVIKSHGYKMSKKKYIEAVQKHLQVKLTDRMISKFAISGQKGPGKNEEDDEGSSPTSLQNRESPTKSQPLGV